MKEYQDTYVVSQSLLQQLVNEQLNAFAKKSTEMLVQRIHVVHQQSESNVGEHREYVLRSVVWKPQHWLA